MGEISLRTIHGRFDFVTAGSVNLVAERERKSRYDLYRVRRCHVDMLQVCNTLMHYAVLPPRLTQPLIPPQLPPQVSPPSATSDPHSSSLRTTSQAPHLTSKSVQSPRYQDTISDTKWRRFGLVRRHGSVLGNRWLN